MNQCLEMENKKKKKEQHHHTNIHVLILVHLRDQILPLEVMDHSFLLKINFIHCSS